MDIRPKIQIEPAELYGYIDSFEINYKTEKDEFIGTFKSRTLDMKLVGIEESSIPTEIKLWISCVKEGQNDSFVQMPTFVIMSYKYDKDSKTATLKGNDYAIKFDEYFDLDLSYPLTIKDLAYAICDAVGVEMYINGIVDENSFLMQAPKVDNKFTYREIMGMVASACGGVAFINVQDGKDRFCIANLREIEYVIQNVFQQEFDGEKFGPIENIEIAREPITDIVRYPAEAVEGATVRIVNNYLIDDNREGIFDFLKPMLLDTSFYTGIINTYEAYEFVPLTLLLTAYDGQYNYFLLNNLCFKYPNVLDGFVGSNKMSKVEIKHNTAKGIERQIKDAEAKVDKVNGEITLVVDTQTKQADNIRELQENAQVIMQDISELKVQQGSITGSVNMTGGHNKVENSVGLFGSDLYTIEDTGTETGLASFGEVAELKSITNSGGMVYACNKKITHESINLISGQEYTITFKYSNQKNNNLKIAIITGTEEVELVNTSENVNLKEVVYTFIATGSCSFYISSTYVDDSVGGFYTDLIIKEGNIRSNWEAANGEYYGTNFSIYRNGVEITSNTSNIKTLINNLGFSVVDNNNTDKILLAMNNLRVYLTNTEINGSLKIIDFTFEEQKISSCNCLLLY